MDNMNFKVGDRVRLTGELWTARSSDTIPVPQIGDIVTITGVSAGGSPEFADPEDEWPWYIVDGGYEAELVEES